MNYSDAVKALLGDESEEFSKKLLDILTKEKGKSLIGIYINEITKQQNSSGYPDFKLIETDVDSRLIYDLLDKEEPQTTVGIMDKLKDSDLSDSLRKYRTHMSSKIRALSSMGYVGSIPNERYSKLYSTSEKAVQVAMNRRKIKLEQLTASEELEISMDTELKPIYVLHAIQRISKK